MIAGILENGTIVPIPRSAYYTNNPDGDAYVLMQIHPDGTAAHIFSMIIDGGDMNRMAFNPALQENLEEWRDFLVPLLKDMTKGMQTFNGDMELMESGDDETDDNDAD